MPSLKSIAAQFLNGSPVPAQYTTDKAVMPSDADLAKIADIARARTAHFAEAAESLSLAAGRDPDSDPEVMILREIMERKGLLEGEMARLRALNRRWDNLYYAEQISIGGADHWPLSETEARDGRVHVSVNVHKVYVDVPAALEAVPPVENYVAASVDDAEREAAGRRERLYFQWKEDDEFELKVHKSCVVKGLYGLAYMKVFWDAIEGRPTARLIDTPENLYVGWGNSDFSRMDFAIYCYGMSPQAIEETFGKTVSAREYKDGYRPVVTSGDFDDPIRTIRPDSLNGQLRGARSATQYEQMFVEVYDYWYRKATRKKGGRAEIWNAVYVGNALVKNDRHREYEDIPYIPIPHTYIPGSPYGRPALYDLEQLLREKDERVTNAAQMLQSVVGGQRWQIVGSEAPETVSDNMIPQPNRMSTPGPNAEIKAITPFVPEFAVEDFIKRIDHELEAASGLNELLLGRAPATILGSSKAIAALVANYEARIRMQRELLYQARKRIWRVAAKVWEAKDSDVRELIDGQYRLDVKAPELTPRDELEVAQMAINLVQNRLWSSERAMDRTGVEDPGEEKTLIRDEQTDIALNPQAVVQQMTVVGTAAQLGMAPPQESVDQVQNAVRQQTRPAGGTASLNGPENKANPPQEALPKNAQGSAVLQTMVNEAGAQGRVLTQTPLGGPAEAA
jgi:hypothetical protein